MRYEDFTIRQVDSEPEVFCAGKYYIEYVDLFYLIDGALIPWEEEQNYITNGWLDTLEEAENAIRAFVAEQQEFKLKGAL